MNFIINLEVYPFDVMVSIGETDEAVVKHLVKKGVPLTECNKHLIEINGKGRSLMFPTGQSLLRLPKKPETNFEMAVLQHEIFHIVQFVMHKVGITLSDDSDEAYAYLIQFLTLKIYNKI